MNIKYKRIRNFFFFSKTAVRPRKPGKGENQSHGACKSKHSLENAFSKYRLAKEWPDLPDRLHSLKLIRRARVQPLKLHSVRKECEETFRDRVKRERQGAQLRGPLKEKFVLLSGSIRKYDDDNYYNNCSCRSWRTRYKMNVPLHGSSCGLDMLIEYLLYRSLLQLVYGS